MNATQLAPYLTAKEAAKYMGTTTRTLATWRYRKEGPPFVKVGASIRYRLTTLEAWLADREQTPGE